eukprot:5063237-Amphidinium_carterae.2
MRMRRLQPLPIGASSKRSASGCHRAGGVSSVGGFGAGDGSTTCAAMYSERGGKWARHSVWLGFKSVRTLTHSNGEVPCSSGQQT